jgi:uncharacterized protein involved in type VI secretion and phage assembly
MALQTPEITIDRQASWTLRRAELIESVCAMGLMHVEVLTDNNDVDPQSMLHKAVSIKLPTLQQGNEWRYVNGIVWHWSSMGPFREEDGKYVHRIVVVPPLMLLSLRRFTRGFNGIPAQQVWRDVLSPYGDRVPFNDNSSMMVLDNEPSTVKLESAHQSDETDLQFLMRTLQTNGVFWFHQSTTDNEPPKLMLGTMSQSAKAWGDGSSLTFDADASEVTFSPTVLQWARHAASSARTPVVHAMHPLVAGTTPPANVMALGASPSDTSFKGFDWFDLDQGAPLGGEGLADLQSRIAKVLEQSMALEDNWATGIATTTTVAPGFKATINNLPGASTPADWFVVSTRTLVAGPGLGSGTSAEEPRMLTSVRAVPLNIPFRPPLDETHVDPPTLGGNAMAMDVMQPLAVEAG